MQSGTTQSGPTQPGAAQSGTTSSPTQQAEQPSLYGGPAKRRVRIRDLFAAKERGERWPMLTSYDQYTAGIFDDAGIPVLLVGDSAANNVYGHDTSLPVTLDELLPLLRAVVRSTNRALVVGDLPFGSYEAGPEQALASAVALMKAGAHAVKLEGGRRMVRQIRALTDAGIPVFGHVGFTPQSEHLLGGYRVQGRGNAGEEAVVADAHAAADAGAVAVVLEMVTGPVAKRITSELAVPTIGIGAGSECDAQVLVWQDMAGLRTGKMPRFVKRYADLAGVLSDATRRFAEEVRTGAFPADAHTFH